ncbi:hypothetical protein M109_1795 [Bacteroides fragilis str. 3397 N2]|nr:hypothetical protein M109_1795 [Bacteroides fragilis str. 3397 N2]
MAVATSIDALAVGVSFAFLGIKSCSSILYPAGIIEKKLHLAGYPAVGNNLDTSPTK